MPKTFSTGPRYSYRVSSGIFNSVLWCSVVFCGVLWCFAVFCGFQAYRRAGQYLLGERSGAGGNRGVVCHLHKDMLEIKKMKLKCDHTGSS